MRPDEAGVIDNVHLCRDTRPTPCVGHENKALKAFIHFLRHRRMSLTNFVWGSRSDHLPKSQLPSGILSQFLLFIPHLRAELGYMPEFLLRSLCHGNNGLAASN